jgi:hypothetical protein
MCLRVSYKEKYKKNDFLAFLKLMKKGVRSEDGVGSEVGSGSAPKCHGSPTQDFVIAVPVLTFFQIQSILYHALFRIPGTR